MVKKINIGVIFFIINSIIFGGFPSGTFVKTEFDYVPIEQLEIGDKVYCYNSNNNNVIKKIMATKNIISDHYLLIITNKNNIITLYNQKFYILDKNIWKEARAIQAGDILFADIDEYVIVKKIINQNELIHFFDITVEDEHNFFISENNILVHNFLPAITFGLSWTFGLGSIEFTGASLGSVCIGSLLGIIFHNNKNFGAQAPGKPSKDDGYIPSKKWDGKKIKNPNGFGYGWPDNKGNVWVPTGPSGHGGAHWDVERPDGSYINIVPGGNIRGNK